MANSQSHHPPANVRRVIAWPRRDPGSRGHVMTADLSGTGAHNMTDKRKPR